MLNYPTENQYALGLMSDDREEFQKAQSEMLELARETRHHANCILMLSRIISALKVSEAKLDPEVEQEVFEIMQEVLIKIEGMTHLGYTNKVLYEIFDILGGAQLLNEPMTEARGVKRFLSWVNLTSMSLATHEYMSPMYTSTTNNALRSLIEEQTNPEVRFKAQIMLERWWLHIALRYHHPMREVAGPYSRCFCQPSIVAGNLRRRIRQAYGWESFYESSRNAERKAEREVDYMPAYIDELMTEKELPCCIREIFQTARKPEHLQAGDGWDWLEMFADHPRAPGSFKIWFEDQFRRKHFRPVNWGTTWLGKMATLGSRNFRGEPYAESHAQSPINVLAQTFNERALRPNHEVYCRYWNEAGETIGRGSIFKCHQEENVALVGHLIDCELGLRERVESGRLMHFWVFEDLDQLDGLWVDGKPASEFPCSLQIDSIVVIKDGSGWIGLRPVFLRGAEGIEPRIEITTSPASDGIRYDGYYWPEGVSPPADHKMLQLRMIHYEGESRSFTADELCPAFAVSAIEVHDEDAFPDAAAFFEHLQKVQISIETNWSESKKEDETVIGYSSHCHSLELNDSRHFLEGSPRTCPKTQVDSPYVNSTVTGSVSLGEAKVDASEPVPMTLVKTPRSEAYVILQIANQPIVDITFSIGKKSIRIPNAEFGRYTVYTGKQEWRVERFALGGLPGHR
ncbi:MAG: hypothetical protein QF473_24060 [Planctomycetota bacterium]|nr:hypothetical protein [Planctomycetota bacterium]